jgi:hypothetical protein
MNHVINPLTDRAPGIVPRFVTSETEKVLGIKRNHFRELRDPYSPNCYCIRYDCQICGMYVWFVKDRPAAIQLSCHYCGSHRVAVDECDGWTNLPLPNLSKPTRLRTAQELIERKSYKLKCAWCANNFEVYTAARNKQKCCSVQCGADRNKYLRVIRESK